MNLSFSGFYGFVLNLHNIMVINFLIKVILLTINFCLLVFSLSLDDISGPIYMIFITAIAVTQWLIGLGILIALYRFRGNLAIYFKWI